ncbi:PhzF family phenazine biosynthesis protein [Trinickia symbiotica]|uniref:PhzF family phenazine biosynthesis protein n=1 Tax=Trinickia symbiotica TaxID=863227 RepID=A0A2N7X340_9BURK|nr:PhzF family phenazine biosynthesis protein [Trinickia symbiotica]PMS36057.1 PhzF family phenazine biosynthesis protein [Trinickia symbiotica]PPK45732.1 PhzF family phenazine biosynthesis protein [Trinickia symbiotica]
MPSRQVRFKQVDVFSAAPFKGNPLAVVFDADGLDTDQMRAIARWTNLSETTFICKPTDPSADYLVRIFTPVHELPFAGHPTLGTAHALVDSGYRPKTAGRLVQQCGVGLVEIEERAAGVRAFSAPPARLTPLAEADWAALREALGTETIDFHHIAPTSVDNGVHWLMVGIDSPETCVALAPDAGALARIAERTGTSGVALYASHGDGGPATLEVRCIVVEGNLSIYEDPVTGSANAGLASLFAAHGRRHGERYTVRQGTALGRDGRVFVEYDDTRGKIWIGGAAATIVDGTIQLP